MAPADQVDVGGRLLELVVDVLAEADDGVGQGRRLAFLLGVDVGVELQLGDDPVELLPGSPSGRPSCSRDSSKSQTTVSLCWVRWRRISRAIWSSAAPTSVAS